MKRKGFNTIMTTIIVVAAVMLAVVISLAAFSEPVKDLSKRTLGTIGDVFSNIFSIGAGGSTNRAALLDTASLPENIKGTAEAGNNFLNAAADVTEPLEDIVSDSGTGVTGAAASKGGAEVTYETTISQISLFNNPTFFTGFDVSSSITDWDLQFKGNLLVMSLTYINGDKPVTAEGSKEIPLVNQDLDFEYELGSLVTPIGTATGLLRFNGKIQAETQGFPLQGGKKYNIGVHSEITGVNTDDMNVEVSVYTTDKGLEAAVSGDAILHLVIFAEEA